MRVILDGRTEDHPESIGKDLIVPRAVGKACRSPFIYVDETKSKIEGKADLTLLYGHPEIGGYVRSFRIKLEIGFGFLNGAPIGFTAGILSEVDTPYTDPRGLRV